MPFVKVVAAKRVSAVIPATTVASIREELIFVFVVADPIAAAFRLGQVLGLAAQTATGDGFRAGFLRGARFSSLADLFLRHDVGPLFGSGIAYLRPQLKVAVIAEHFILAD
jgi:hypothetical protein